MRADAPEREGPCERRPLGNVLVATDFSPGAARAVARAARLPMCRGATLTVLHVQPPACAPEDRAQAEQALRRAAAVVAEAARAAHVDVFTRLVEGLPFVENIRGALHGRNELVVLGRHGTRAFRELLLGSTAERVIRKGDTSILVVASRPVAAYERPLVAVDCSDTSRLALELAWRLTDGSVVALDVVHAYEPILEAALENPLETKRRAEAAVEAFLASSPASPPATVALRDGDARHLILDVAAQTGADLLALGTHGRSGLGHVLLGSVAEGVIRGASCDVVVARAIGSSFKLP